MVKNIKKIESGVTGPTGYRAAGVHAGIKGDKLDLALVVSEEPAAIAGTFTTNRIQGAPVKVCRERMTGGKRAIVINSGNANACTGPKGLEDAYRMALLTADQLDLDEEDVLVCSTGVIGVPLPMAKIESGIQAVAAALSTEGGQDAAKAIMTTDTVDKQIGLEFVVDGKTIRLGGMAKGSGMIEPNMATVLAFLTTDAAVEAGALQKCLSTAVAMSFNRISIDGDQSCNDTMLFMANGKAGNAVLNEDHAEWPLFCEAVEQATLELALAMVKDGEGATKFVTVRVKGARSFADARKAARAVANSLLFKTACFGEDPNWGRVIDAVGYSGSEIKEEIADIFFDDVAAFKSGCNMPENLKRLESVMKQESFSVIIDLHLGEAEDRVYTCDCSLDYVRINSEYTT